MYIVKESSGRQKNDLPPCPYHVENNRYYIHMNEWWYIYLHMHAHVYVNICYCKWLDLVISMSLFRYTVFLSFFSLKIIQIITGSLILCHEINQVQRYPSKVTTGIFQQIAYIPCFPIRTAFSYHRPHVWSILMSWKPCREASSENLVDAINPYPRGILVFWRSVFCLYSSLGCCMYVCKCVIKLDIMGGIGSEKS